MLAVSGTPESHIPGSRTALLCRNSLSFTSVEIEPEAIEWVWCGRGASSIIIQPHPLNRLQLYQTIFYLLGS
jgi:hypothetical protein